MDRKHTQQMIDFWSRVKGRPRYPARCQNGVRKYRHPVAVLLAMLRDPAIKSRKLVGEK